MTTTIPHKPGGGRRHLSLVRAQRFQSLALRRGGPALPGLLQPEHFGVAACDVRDYGRAVLPLPGRSIRPAWTLAVGCVTVRGRGRQVVGLRSPRPRL
jgi:hypothetical protein